MLAPPGLGLLTSKAMDDRFGVPMLARFMWGGFQPTGAPAYLTAGETFGVAAGAALVNAAAVAAAYETGVAVGSLVIAAKHHRRQQTAFTGDDDCPCE